MVRKTFRKRMSNVQTKTLRQVKKARKKKRSRLNEDDLIEQQMRRGLDAKI